MQSIVIIALLGGLRVGRPVALDAIVDVRDARFEMLNTGLVRLMGVATKTCGALIMCT